MFLRHLPADLELEYKKQATLLDDLIISSCDAVWEVRIANEMEEPVEPFSTAPN